MTTFFADADIPAMLADFGVPVVFDGVSGQKGVVDYVDAVTLQQNGIAGVTNKAITVMLQTSAFPSLAANSAVVAPTTMTAVCAVLTSTGVSADWVARVP